MKNVMLDDEVHKKLSHIKLNKGYKTLSETIGFLIRERKKRYH